MVDIWYAKNTNSAATTLTITPNPSGSTGGGAVIWEFANVDTVSPLDQTATLDNQLARTTPAGATVTIGNPGELVISVISPQDTASRIGFKHLTISSSGTYTPQWAQNSSGTNASTTVSFKAANSVGILSAGAGAGGGTNPCDLNQDGTVNVVDVQLAINMYIQPRLCPANINGGVCDNTFVSKVITATLGGACTATFNHYASLSWTPSASSNVIDYNVYRGTTPGGPYTKINPSLVSATSYTDSSVAAGQTYYYVATAVDNSNNESAYSTEAQAVVPSP